MGDVVSAFDEHRGGPRGYRGRETKDGPWRAIRDNEMPPMMFQLRLRDGSMVSFAYGDIREIRCRDAGHIQVFILAFRRMVVRIEGRHLKELAGLLGCGMIRWIEEADIRSAGKPESEPEVIAIAIEDVTEH